jgi:hypothetical protein
MPDFRIVLNGPPYAEPRYYGALQWNDRNVYIRYAGGGKDSRHSDGGTFLASTGHGRSFEQRLPTSEVSRELVSFISLKAPMTEPPPLRGPIRKSDLVLPTTSAGTAPRLAVELVENSRVSGVLAAWERNPTVSSVQTYVDKGLGQTLVVALAGAHDGPPSTSAA